jgi:hypothetical protein
LRGFERVEVLMVDVDTDVDGQRTKELKNENV